MIRGEGVHLVPSAFHPQTVPGPECQEWSKAGPDPDTEFRSTFARLWHLYRPTGMCDGCFGRHPARRTVKGLWLAPHEPSPPQHHTCPHCPEPMVPPSYTDVGHPWCGTDESEGYGDEL